MGDHRPTYPRTAAGIRLRRLTVTNKFKSSVLMGRYLMWETYYLAQCGIAIGFLREKLGDK
jgi:hypothetical protein